MEFPTACEVWSVIRFLKPKNVHSTKFTGRFFVCDEGTMNEGNVSKWYCLFKKVGQCAVAHDRPYVHIT